MTKLLQLLNQSSFTVRWIITDNHSANFCAIKLLLQKYRNKLDLYINHTSNYDTMAYLFYNTVHLLKSNWNNLTDTKKLVFLLFMYQQGRSHCGGLRGQGGHDPPFQFLNQTRSNSFSFKHHGYCDLRLLRNYMNQISWFLLCMLQCLDNLRQPFIF